LGYLSTFARQQVATHRYSLQLEKAGAPSVAMVFARPYVHLSVFEWITSSINWHAQLKTR
jgi:hypothetical protein